MNKPSFHVKKLRVYQVPDLTDEATQEKVACPSIEFEAGDLVDLGHQEGFGLAIILGFTDPLLKPLSGRAGDTGFMAHGFLVNDHDRLVRLARPYAYASCTGTTSPSVLTGVEVFEMRADKLLDVVKRGQGFVK